MRLFRVGRLYVFLILGILTYSTSSLLHAQQPIGGPYEPDSNTVLLMHFDGDYQIESDYRIGNVQVRGEPRFDNKNSDQSFGSQLRLDNDDQLRTNNYLLIPDTAALDLEGSWTIQIWVNVLNVPSYYRDWLHHNILIQKPGDETFYKQNYGLRLSFDSNSFISGYFCEECESSSVVNSTSNLMELGEWYHVTFVRDTSLARLVQFVYKNDEGKISHQGLELVSKQSKSIDVNREDPQHSDAPLFIGTSPSNDTSNTGYADLLIDELRISNRNEYKERTTSIAGQEGENGLPKVFSLERNYPNPFNPTTTIEYALPEDERVKITVYNIMGRQVATLVNSRQQAGRHSVRFDASNLASGVYIYRIQAGSYTNSKRMILIK